MTTNETNVQNPSIMKSLAIITAVVIILTAMHFAASFIMPVLLSAFFAILLSPIYGWLKRKRVPGGLALLLSIGVFALVGLFLMWLLGTSLATLGQSLASYADKISSQQAQLEAKIATLHSSSLKAMLSSVDLSKLTGVVGFFLGAAVGVFKTGLILLVMTTFILAEGSQFKERMVKAYGADHFMPRNMIAIAGSMISYFGLRILVNLVVAIGTGLMLWAFKIPHAGLWAVMTFFFSFIPYIGAVIALTPAVILAFAQGGVGLAVLVIVLSLVINGLSENIVAPLVMGKGLSVSPTVVFLSFLFWMFILGGAGAFIAMPLTVALIMFMNTFEETRNFAALMIPTEPS
jgi:AI-2 transport protein TqsA